MFVITDDAGHEDSAALHHAKVVLASAEHDDRGVDPRRSNRRSTARIWRSVSKVPSGEKTPRIASPGEALTASATGLGRGAQRKIVNDVKFAAQKAAAMRSSGIIASASRSASRVRRRSAVRLLSAASGVGAWGRMHTPIGGGRERSRHRQTSCAPASTSPSSSNGRRMPRRCGRTGFGPSCRTRLGHTCSRCAQWRFWRRLDEGPPRRARRHQRPFVVREQLPRARERGADRRQDRERSVVRLAFERRPPEFGARGLGRSLQMTRRGGA